MKPDYFIEAAVFDGESLNTVPMKWHVYELYNGLISADFFQTVAIFKIYLRSSNEQDLGVESHPV